MIYYPKSHTWLSMKAPLAEGEISMLVQILIDYVLDSCFLVSS